VNAESVSIDSFHESYGSFDAEELHMSCIFNDLHTRDGTNSRANSENDTDFTDLGALISARMAVR
jgi:hypothetical protein